MTLKFFNGAFFHFFHDLYLHKNHISVTVKDILEISTDLNPRDQKKEAKK
jgi:hypothetical protein